MVVLTTILVFRYPGVVTRILSSIEQTQLEAQTFSIKGVGVLGDSQADEYRTDDSRGLTYASTTFNWVELLARYRNINFGPNGTWGEPRRSGYEYNFSRTGATVNSMFVSGQIDGLAKEVKDGNVNVVIIAIGANDFAPYITPDGYDAIYNKQVSKTDQIRKKNQIISDIATAIDILKSSGEVRIILVLIPDWGNHLGVRLAFPIPEQRMQVSSLVQETNNDLVKLAENENIVSVNPNDFYQRVFEDSLSGVTIGGETFTAVLPGDDPRSLFLEDGTHPGTILNGLFANEIILALQQSTAASINLFTDEEILSMAGL